MTSTKDRSFGGQNNAADIAICGDGVENIVQGFHHRAGKRVSASRVGQGYGGNTVLIVSGGKWRFDAFINHWCTPYQPHSSGNSYFLIHIVVVELHVTGKK